jgi:uncharacterized protein DUF3310
MHPTCLMCDALLLVGENQGDLCGNCFRQLQEARQRRHQSYPRQPSVDHPPHYGGDVPHETVKCLEAWGLERDALLWNTVKYISRAGKKGDQLEDLKKARWYLDRRIAKLEAKP